MDLGKTIKEMSSDIIKMIDFLDQRLCQIFCIKSSTSTDSAVLGQAFGVYLSQMSGCQISFLLTNKMCWISER